MDIFSLSYKKLSPVGTTVLLPLDGIFTASKEQGKGTADLMIPLGNWLTILGLDLTILGPGLGLSHFGSHMVTLMAKLGPYRVILGPNLAILGPDFVVLRQNPVNLGPDSVY